MDSLASEALWQRRLWGVLMSIFAALALTLACIGLYGVMSHLVSLRSREIGIRMAVGADRGKVLSIITREGMLLVCIGLAAGGVTALLAGRWIRALLFGVSPEDPATFLTVAALLAAIAAIACLVPAWRAARIDPVRALREE
jgi:ABC-type antimicrobial peptide transport system permease subunit